MFSLNKKVAVVTGAGSGIGLAIGRLFSQRGATVVGIDLNSAGADTASESGMHGVAQDVTDPAGIARVFDDVKSTHGGVDILVNNAGIAHIGTLLSTSDEDLMKLFKVNVQSIQVVSRHAVEQMKTKGAGVVLNLASIASLVGLKDRFAYSMTKGAVLTMTRSIAADYMDDGIRCNCVCPARVHTPFVDQFIAANYPGREKEMFDELSRSQPIGRMGTPEEIAALALYLCADESSFITGAAFPIDGGYTAL